MIHHLIHTLFSELAAISEEHGEIHDTHVRDTLHLTLNFYFIWGNPCTRFPCHYYMFTKQGNLAVSNAVKKFLLAVNECEEIKNIPLGQRRLDLLQNDELGLAEDYDMDEFIGYAEKVLPLEPLCDSMFVMYDDE